MKTINTKTPSGKEITLNETGRYFKQPIPQLNNKIHTIVQLEGDKTMYVIAKDQEEIVQNFYDAIRKEKKEVEIKELNQRIPGYTELQNAYEYRANQIYTNEKYMQRLFDTSIGSGDKGDIVEAEAKVKELEEKYPIAQKYIKWNHGNPACSSGYAANKAAEALYNGATIEEAIEISKDWNHWD